MKGLLKTLVVDVDATRAQEFMNWIGKAGMNYVLSANWKKLEVLPLRCEAIIRKPDNDSVKQKDSIVYLGDGAVQRCLHRPRVVTTHRSCGGRVLIASQGMVALQASLAEEAPNFRGVHYE